MMALVDLSAMDKQLIEAARNAVFQRGDGVRHTVGAALLASGQSTTTGVNVFAQGGGACAELVVLGTALSRGEHDFETIVAVGDRDRGVIGPCGVCRQLLLDYAPTIDVILNTSGGLGRVPIKELMPMAAQSWFAFPE
jgi:cytidine deaminase